MEQIAEKMNDLIKIDFEGVRVLTTKQLAEAYETKENNIQNNFRNNSSRFIEGKHYYRLFGNELKIFKRKVNDVDLVASNVNNLILWTEKGASRMCKILDTDKAWQQFDILEETYFNVKHIPRLNPMDLLELEFKALKETQKDIQEVKQEFKELPLQLAEAEELQKAINNKIVTLLGGKKSLAYKDKSLRSKAFTDIYKEVKRQFGLNTYKAIKRKNLDKALDIVNSYKLPLFIEELF